MNMFKKVKADSIVTALIGLLVIGSGCAPAQPAGLLKPERVIGAYASWRQKEVPPEALPWSRLTHVGYAFALPKPDGSIDMTHAQGLADVVRAAKRHQVAVFLAIGGANGSAPFRVIATDPELRARFAEQVLKLTQRYGLDGVDIDWEHWAGGEPDPAGRQALLDLMTELYAKLHPAGKLLTADVFATDWLGKHYDAALIDQVDWLHIMAYDGSGSWSEKPGPHADVRMLPGVLDYWIQKVGEAKRHKLVLNLPFYGKRFPTGFVSGQAVPDMDYRDILAAHPEAANQDLIKAADYRVYYDGRPAIHQKAVLAQERGLGGVGIWELTQDSPDPEKSLISVFAPR